MGNNTSVKFCQRCNIYGHMYEEHTNCIYCLDDHATAEHVCEKCEDLGHSIKQHCSHCEELHKTYEHKCTICDIEGHETLLEEHIYKCDVCERNNENKLKYTHDTNNHVNYLGLVNIREDDKKLFKYCDICEKVICTKNDQCINCLKKVSKMIKCSRDSCCYTADNNLVKYCPYCGNNIIGVVDI